VLGWRRLVAILRPVCAALQAAHGRQIVHRDVKPSNLFLHRPGGDDGDADFVKVLDFGIVKMLAGAERRAGGHHHTLTSNGLFIGTPHYAAPEAIEPQIFGPVGVAADVYALGVIMYQSLAGALPFEGEPRARAVYKTAYEDPPPLRVRAPERLIAPAVDAVVMRALARRPADRYPSIRALLEAIQQVPDEPTAPRAMIASRSMAGQIDSTTQVHPSRPRMKFAGSPGQADPASVRVSGANPGRGSGAANLAATRPFAAKPAGASSEPVTPSPVTADPDPPRQDPAKQPDPRQSVFAKSAPPRALRRTAPEFRPIAMQVEVPPSVKTSSPQPAETKLELSAEARPSAKLGPPEPVGVWAAPPASLLRSGPQQQVRPTLPDRPPSSPQNFPTHGADLIPRLPMEAAETPLPEGPPLRGYSAPGVSIGILLAVLALSIVIIGAWWFMPDAPARPTEVHQR
jgi:serine/threonine-protein kinase